MFFLHAHYTGTQTHRRTLVVVRGKLHLGSWFDCQYVMPTCDEICISNKFDRKGRTESVLLTLFITCMGLFYSLFFFFFIILDISIKIHWFKRCCASSTISYEHIPIRNDGDGGAYILAHKHTYWHWYWYIPNIYRKY